MSTIKIEDAPAWAQRHAKTMEEAALRGLRSAAQRIITKIQTDIIPNTKLSDGRVAPPVDRGQYRAGWRYRPITRGAMITHIDQKMAAIMEYGVRAENVKIGRKMIDALTTWVMRKSLALDAIEAKQIAWAIAKTMKDKGMEGRKVLERAMAAAPDIVREEVNYELQRALRKG